MMNPKNTHARIYSEAKPNAITGVTSSKCEGDVIFENDFSNPAGVARCLIDPYK